VNKDGLPVPTRHAGTLAHPTGNFVYLRKPTATPML